MNLDNVRELKSHLLGRGAPVVAKTAIMRGIFTGSDTAESIDTVCKEVAVGIALSKTNQFDFHLALRVPSLKPRFLHLIDHIKLLSHDEVDVRCVGRVKKKKKKKTLNPTHAAYYQSCRRPLCIGSSICYDVEGIEYAGTLGCFVRDSASDVTYMLSNNHVLANENAAEIGGSVVQPGTLDAESVTENVIGAFAKQIRLKKRGTNFVDAAIADVAEGIEFDPTTIGSLGQLVAVGDHMELPDQAVVYKVGRTTGQTTGRLTAFDIDNVQVDYDLGTLRFDNQIEFEGIDNNVFSDSGDSGSLIVDDSMRAIALLFAGSDEGGSNGHGVTYGNPIATVLNALGIEMVLG